MMCVLCAMATALYDATRLDESRAAAAETKMLAVSREVKMLPAASASARESGTPARCKRRRGARFFSGF